MHSSIRAVETVNCPLKELAIRKFLPNPQHIQRHSRHMLLHFSVETCQVAEFRHGHLVDDGVACPPGAPERLGASR